MRQMELFEEMEEKDPHLFSQLQTRKNAVTGLDFEVIPFGDEPLDKEIADFIEEQLNGIESFEDVENDLLDAIGKGFAYPRSCGAMTKGTSWCRTSRRDTRNASFGTRWTIRSRCERRTCRRASCSRRTSSSFTGTRLAAVTPLGLASSELWRGCTSSRTTT
jgi:hypothetical protein